MAILRDIQKDGTYVEFSFIKCIPGEFEGCQLNFRYYIENKQFYEVDFGWTNQTIKNYVEVTSKFPLDVLNDFILNNLYISYEKHLYKLEWAELAEVNIYSLRFFGCQQDFSLIVVDNDVKQFGYELESEWKKGLSLAGDEMK